MGAPWENPHEVEVLETETYYSKYSTAARRERERQRVKGSLSPITGPLNAIYDSKISSERNLLLHELHGDSN